MLISERWLREWLDPPVDTQGLCDQLTMAGLEIETLVPAAPAFSGVVVAQILEVAPHPSADKLRICRVSTGQDTVLQIVCGAANVCVGMLAPLAGVGAKLPDGTLIAAAKLRGVESLGMLCSARELGLSEKADGLYELPLDAKVGQGLREYLQLDDTLIEISITPNRGDCLSVLGIARELAAINRLALRQSGSGAVASKHGVKREVRVTQAQLCPNYLGRVIRGIRGDATTPRWLQERLRRSGQRSIHPVVDVTNYVMLELGQPTHAFDLAKLQGAIEVRHARPGEKLRVLTGDEIQLHASSLVIADQNGPIALAGVMGGADSAVGADTRDIFLESACFTPRAVAGTARRYKLHTDSSQRFERGVDPQLQIRALEQATALLLEIVGGEPGPVTPVSNPLAPITGVPLRQSRLTQVLGTEIAAREVEDILQRLQMQVRVDGTDAWRVTPPSWRYDIALEADLIEEVARIHGYQHLPAQTRAVALPAVPETETRLEIARVRETLVQRGYHEAITYSFVDPMLQRQLLPEAAAIDLDNPIASNLAQMRTTLWSSLLPALRYNRQRQQPRVRLFEIGTRFQRGAAGAVSEDLRLAGLADGSAWPEQWGGSPRPVDFYDVKADLEALLSLGGRSAEFVFTPATHPALHPGQSARVSRDGREVGWLGRLHPRLLAAFDLKSAPVLFDLALSEVRAAAVPAYRPLSEFPGVRRDLAVIVAECLPTGEIIECLQSAKEPLLSAIHIFDIYRGQGLPSACKSVALALNFQDKSRTLQDAEVDAALARLRLRLQQELKAGFRE
ncbi:MAG: phenylalanine--tRNA ligase subunit beta [Nevskiales bacterium]